MKNLIGALGETVSKTGEAIGKNFESAEERQQTLTERHKIDMASDNPLAKLIRPVTLLVLLLLQLFIVVFSAFGNHVDPAIVAQHGVLLAGAFGFYFNSRKAEKIADKNAKANIEMSKLESRHDRKLERKEARLERRLERRAERNQDKND